MASGTDNGEPPSIQASPETGAGDDCGTSIHGIAPEDIEIDFEAGGVGMKYVVLYEKTSTGFSAHVPDLPGCVAAGRTRKETERLMRGAIQMHVAGMREDGDPIPAATTYANFVSIAHKKPATRNGSARLKRHTTGSR